MGFTILTTTHEVRIMVGFGRYGAAVPPVPLPSGMLLAPKDAVFTYVNGDRLGDGVNVRGRTLLPNGAPRPGDLRAKYLRFAEHPWLDDVRRVLDDAYLIRRSTDVIPSPRPAADDSRTPTA